MKYHARFLHKSHVQRFDSEGVLEYLFLNAPAKVRGSAVQQFQLDFLSMKAGMSDRIHGSKLFHHPKIPIGEDSYIGERKYQEYRRVYLSHRLA